MSIKYLGDVHLGKAFMEGVPLHRRGDREAMQWAQFTADLAAVDGVHLHIQVGDLFDKFQVSNNVAYRTAQAYRAAAKANPHVIYIVNRGNHDASRDLERVSSYQMFAAMCSGLDNLIVLQDEPVNIEDVIVLPWHPTITAREMVLKHEWMFDGAKTAVGHWDVVVIGENTNAIPAQLLSSLGIEKAVTGHDHIARALVIDGLEVQVTGSMQPYSHGEDPNEQIYMTRSLAEVLADQDAFHDKCLRIVLGPTEVLDSPIDCLALQLGRQKDAGVEAIEVEFEVFDFQALYDQAVDEVGLTTDMATIVSERIEVERAARS